MAKARIHSIVSVKQSLKTAVFTCVLFHWSKPNTTFLGVYKTDRERAGDYWMPRVGDTVQHFGNKISKVVSRSYNQPNERKEDTMSVRGKMSEDRINFFLHYRYYKPELNEVLVKAFGLTEHQVLCLRKDNPHGFWVHCRPSQFARFMIYRDETGMVNGFKDLNAALVEPSKPETLAENISKKIGAVGSVNGGSSVSVCMVTKILDLVGMDPHEKISCNVQPDGMNIVEVWSNPHNNA